MELNSENQTNREDTVATALLLANQLESKGELQNSLDQLNNAVSKMVEQYSSESDLVTREQLRSSILNCAERAVNLKSSIDSQITENEEINFEVPCEVLMCIQGVRLFRVLPQKTDLLSEGALSLVKASNGALNFLEVNGAFHFPLTDDVPCLKTPHGFYMFPLDEHIFYGLAFPQNIPAAYALAFERLVGDLCPLRIEELSPIAIPDDQIRNGKVDQLIATSSADLPIMTPEVASSNSPLLAVGIRKMTTGIEAATPALVRLIEASTRMLAYGIETGGGFIQSRITPLEQPVAIPGNVSTGLRYAATTSEYVSTIPAIAIAQIAAVASHVAKISHSYFSSSSSSSQKNSSDKKEGESETKESAKHLGKTTVKSAITIWHSLSGAGDQLAASLQNSTAAVITHRYGEEAGEATKNAIKTAYHLYTIDLAPRSLAKQTALSTGKTTVKAFLDEKKSMESSDAVVEVEMKIVKWSEKEKMEQTTK